MTEQCGESDQFGSTLSLPIGYEVVRSIDYALIRDQKYLKNWDGYVHDLLASGHVRDAALYDLRGARLATSRPDFGLSFEEFSTLLYGYVDTNHLRTQGVSVNGTAYDLAYADGRRGIMGRLGLPAAGCSICKTNKLLIVAVHSNRMKGKLCNQTVMNMGDFFLRKDL